MNRPDCKLGKLDGHPLRNTAQGIVNEEQRHRMDAGLTRHLYFFITDIKRQAMRKKEQGIKSETAGGN
jgi:hypothetical protein